MEIIAELEDKVKEWAVAVVCFCDPPLIEKIARFVNSGEAKECLRKLLDNEDNPLSQKLEKYLNSPENPTDSE